MQYSTSSENYSTTFKDKPSKWSGGSKEGKGGYAYKKASYQYSGNGNNTYNYSDKSMDQNIDQLDALLEDLKNERQVSRETKDLIATPTGYRTFERETIEPAGTITKTTKVIKTTKQLGGSQYLDEAEKYATSDYSTLRSNSGFSTLRDYPKTDEYRTREITTYETNKAAPVTVPAYETKSEVYKSSNRILENTELVPTTNTSNTTSTTTHLERDLQDIALGDDILPVPGTKVTTTVRTYTYEIPANAPLTASTSTLNRNVNYSTLQRNVDSTTSSTTATNVLPIGPAHSPPTHVPPTVVYNTESYSTYNKNNERPVVSNRHYEVHEHHESNTVHRDLLPTQPHSQPLRQQPPIAAGPQPVGGSKTIVYNINRTENIKHLPVEPQTNTITNTTITNHSYRPHSPNGNYAPQPAQPGPTTSRYFYKESSNTVNTIHGPPGNADLPPLKRSPSGNYPPTIHYPIDNGAYPPSPPPTTHHHHVQPPPAQTTMYNYKYSTTSNTNTRRNGPDYGATPAPFPVDGNEYPPRNGNPPQRVEELMQSFSNGDVVDRHDIETPHRKREIETNVASPNQPIIPSVNKAGREVYYPPGHDTMIMKREEMHAGSAAGGRWAKGSGMYEYESGYKSKSKTKSGGAMVPVCLPLCCAMPCSIM